MRVVSCLTALAWLLTLAEPCLRPPACGTQAPHQCCCADRGECTCHLESHGTPAPPPVAGPVQVSQDQQSLPAAEAGGLLASRIGAATLASTHSGPPAPSLPIYLSSRAFRC